MSGHPVRRVVTGVDPGGRAVVVSDDEVAPVRARLWPGSAWHLLWSDDAPVVAGTPAPGPVDYFPPTGGVRFGTFTLPPATATEDADPDDATDDGAARAELDGLLPGLRATLDADPAGFHATATVDFELVLSGEVTLELPDGTATRLRAGDTVVQNGARHRWVNTGSEPVVIALVMLGVAHPPG